MANTYDFYKPRMESEYPEVDGALSVKTYIVAVDKSYEAFRNKHARFNKIHSHGANGHANGHANGVNGTNGHSAAPFSLDDADFHLFHSPYGKQAQKGHARLVYNDWLLNPSRYSDVPSPESITALSYDASVTDKSVEKTFINVAKSAFKTKVGPGMAASKRCGNMYTASLYSCLASLISTVEPSEIKDKRATLFAFGSGCAASFFSVKFKGDTTEIKEKMDLISRLAAMDVVPPQEFVDALKLREKNHNAVTYTPEGSVEAIWPGAFYLEDVDSKGRRKYLRAPKA
jgi:hydroxymethylglutaryl-CoA synthase